MVRTYWLVQVFNEASWNLDLQPDRTDDQVESDSAPRYVQVNGSRERPKGLAAQIAEVGELEPLAQEIEHARLLAAKARLDVNSFVNAHIDAILAA